MADVTVKKLEDMQCYDDGNGPNGIFYFAGKSLGVSAWGMNLLKMPAGWQDYPDHDHASGFQDGQEEVYVVMEGSVTLKAGEESWEMKVGDFARVGAAQKRKLIPGAEGAVVLALGGTPGKAYEGGF